MDIIIRIPEKDIFLFLLNAYNFLHLQENLPKCQILILIFNETLYSHKSPPIIIGFWKLGAEGEWWKMVERILGEDG